MSPCTWACSPSVAALFPWSVLRFAQTSGREAVLPMTTGEMGWHARRTVTTEGPPTLLMLWKLQGLFSGDFSAHPSLFSKKVEKATPSVSRSFCNKVVRPGRHETIET